MREKGKNEVAHLKRSDISIKENTTDLEWSEIINNMDALMEQYNRTRERRSIESLPKWCE